VTVDRDAHRDEPGQAALAPPVPGTTEAPARQRVAVAARVRWLIRAIRDIDDAAVEEAVLRLSRSRRLFAPLALAVGAVVMLFEGLKLLFSNWRLTLIQVLPAMWIWAAMYDLKAHVFYGKTYHVVPGPPLIRPAFREARSHLAVVLGSGAVVGLCLALSTGVFIRWGLWWFAIALSIVLAVMMVAYVAVPARLIGVKPTQSRRDKLTAAAVGGAIGAVVCTPPYLLGRAGLVMLGYRALLIPGIIVFLVGLTLQAGTTSAVKAVKLGAKLITGRTQVTDGSPPPRSAPPAVRD